MSMMKPLMHLTLPEIGPYTVESHFAPLVHMMEGPIKVNQEAILQSIRREHAGLGPRIPPLYQSGVYYQEDEQGREDWRDCLAILDRLHTTGQGCDCDNLVCWRVGELRAYGIQADPVIKWQYIPQWLAVQLGYRASTGPGDPAGVPPEGLWIIHCCVRFPDQRSANKYGVACDGLVEDTSKNLGMGGGYTSRV